MLSGSGTGTFTANLTALQPGISYYVRAFATNGAGTGYGSTLTFTTIVPPSDYLVSTVAGSRLAGFVDGPGTVATFNSPEGLTIDPNGNLYIADYRTIRKIDPQGNVTTFATIPAAGDDIVGDAAGNLYVITHSQLIYKITPAGVISTLAGGGVTRGADGMGTAANFRNMISGAIDNSGNLYVTDSNVIRKITPDGNVSTLAPRSSGSIFVGIAVDGQQNVFVSDSLQIKKFDASSKVTVIANLQKGTHPAHPGMIELRLDASGNLIGTDGSNCKIVMITPAGVVKTIAGTGYQGYLDGPGSIAKFYSPTGEIIDANGTIYITDELYPTIRKIAHK